MGFHRGGRTITDSLCFYFDALNKKSYSGSGIIFKDLFSKAEGVTILGPTQTIGLVNNHLLFNCDGVSRSCYISFPITEITLPTGSTGSWAWSQYFIDSGDISHQNFGNSTANGGFCFRTGWGLDGPRWGIGGVWYNIYELSIPSRYKQNQWQHYTVTFNGNVANGLKTYLNGILVDERTPTVSIIGSTPKDLWVGADPYSGGNWNGYQDTVQIWLNELTNNQVLQNYNATKSRFGL